jgi:hypothetical protein
LWRGRKKTRRNAIEVGAGNCNGQNEKEPPETVPFGVLHCKKTNSKTTIT